MPMTDSSPASAIIEPTLTDVLRARKVIRPYLTPTPTLRPSALSHELGCEIVLKCENLNPTGAFKVRGGINLISSFDAEQRALGVATASTGNHAQSIAYAANLFGVRAVIYMPAGANPDKVAATELLGATVVQAGADFDECRGLAAEHAQREGMRFIHSANEPLLIAGVGTYALELIEDEPDLDVVIVPVGGGSGACGVATVIKTVRPQTRVIAVQAANMPAVHQAFHTQQMVALEGGSTFAEGLATRVTFDMPFGIMQRLVDDVQLVSEDEMREGMVTLLHRARIVAEGAGAAAMALAQRLAPELQGQRVGVIVSGGNVTLDTLRDTINHVGAAA